MRADEIMPGKLTRIERAREFRRQPTAAEAKLWQSLRNRQLGGLKFRRQHLISPFILDFYCPAAALAVEIDGGIHARTADYDQARTAFLAAAEIHVLRFSNHQVESDLQAVLTAILSTAQARLTE